VTQLRTDGLFIGYYGCWTCANTNGTESTDSSLPLGSSEPRVFWLLHCARSWPGVRLRSCRQSPTPFWRRREHCIVVYTAREFSPRFGPTKPENPEPLASGGWGWTFLGYFAFIRYFRSYLWGPFFWHAMQCNATTDVTRKVRCPCRCHSLALLANQPCCGDSRCYRSLLAPGMSP
jgi:hypothetical protein